MQAQARRGKALECQIERVFRQLNELEHITAIRLEIRRAYSTGRHLAKQPFDYFIVAGPNFFAFDAKECASAKWYPSRAPEHQKHALQKLQSLGHQAGFVVEFTRHRGLPGAIRWITDFTRPATVDSGAAFDWEMFL